MQSPSLEHRTLLWLVVGASVGFAVVLWPFLGAVLWAIFIAIVFDPLHQRVLRQTGGRRSLAALLSLFLILVIVILPLIMVGASVVQEASVMVQKMRSGEVNIGLFLQRMFESLPGWAQAVLDRFGIVNVQSLQRQFTALLTSSGQFITTRVVGIGQITLDFVVAMFVMLYLLFFLMRDGRLLSGRIADAAPLEPQHTQRLMAQFVTVVRATVKGNVVIALIQGVLGGLAFAVLGLPGAMLWGALMALLSLLPAVGAALVWGPVAIYLLATGQLIAGFGLTAWGVLVIGLVDNVLRPVLVGKDTRMPDYVVLVATLGGISVFGLNGFVIGPVIAAMFLVAWNLFTAVRRQPGGEAG
ncbi:MAG TPA: AI-2E family transporter [Ramlibacter sp.]|nr:AI-2E family transporter [Ramlibacter sp.]